MYYLRKKPYEQTIEEIHKTNGEIIPERKIMTDDRAIFKHPDYSRFYRGSFSGLENKHQGMKVYRCKTLKKIMEIRQSTFDYCGELFDVYYDENNIISV